MNATGWSYRRRGFTFTVVLLFLILMFALWMTVCRTSASLVRVQTARVQQDLRDERLMNALAQTLSNIEDHPKDLNKTGSNTYSGSVQTSQGPVLFTATIVYQGDQTQQWIVTLVLQ